MKKIMVLLVGVVLICAVYIYNKNSYFDKIVGDSAVFELSYHKGFSIYRELIYANKSGDEKLFNKVVAEYEADPGNKKCNFKKTTAVQTSIHIFRSLPFNEYSEDQIKEHVTFETEDCKEGTNICNGGKFIVIRVYSLR